MRNYKKEYENYHSKPEQKIRRAARNAARRRFKDADPNKDVHHKDNDPLNNDLNNLSLVTQHYNRKEPRLREKKLKDLQAKLSKALTQKENVKEGVSDPEQLAKEIEWAQSPKNIDSKVLSRAQKQDMRDTMRFIRKLRNPNWVSKFTQIYFTSDNIVQRRLYAAAVKAFGNGSALLKKLFPKGPPKYVKEGIDSDAMIDLMQKYLNTKNKAEKKALLKQINRYQKKLGLKVTEDMGSTTGAHIAGTGDDNTVHTRRKKKKITPAKRRDLTGRIELIKGMAKKWQKKSK